MSITAIGRILIIAHCFPPENSVGALRPYRFFKYLPKFGYATHVVTASDQDPCNRPNGVYHSVDPLLRNSGVRRIMRTCLEYLHPGTGPTLGWVPSAYATARAVIESVPISVVLSTSPPPPAHLTAFWLKRRYPGLKWVADFRDPITENPVSYATTREGRVLSRTSSKFGRVWDSWMERLIFRHADLLIANTDSTAKMWRSSYPQSRHKITHIWNGFDPEEKIGPAVIPERGYRVLAHVGEIYGGRHPGILLASLRRLIEGRRLDPARFQVRLIGPIDRRTILDREVLDILIGKGCVVVEPGVASPMEAAQRMAEVDFLLLIDWVEDRSGLQVPSKLYPYLRIGRPILSITKKDSPVARILARSGVPFAMLHPDDCDQTVDEKVQAFIELSSEPTRANDWFRRNFDGERQVQHLAGLLNRLHSELTP